MKKEYTEAEYKAMVGKLCRFSGICNDEPISAIGILRTATRVNDVTLFLLGGALYDNCEPLTAAEAMQYIYHPEPAKRTKDNLFVGLRPEWLFATIDKNGWVDLHRTRPYIGDQRELGTCDFGLVWLSEKYPEPVGHIFDIEPWIDITDPDAWKTSLIERPEGV